MTGSAPNPEDVPLTVAQAAAVLGVSTWTIYSWRRRRGLTAVGHLSDGTAVYRLADLREVAADGRARRAGQG